VLLLFEASLWKILVAEMQRFQSNGTMSKDVGAKDENCFPILFWCKKFKKASFKAQRGRRK